MLALHLSRTLIGYCCIGPFQHTLQKSHCPPGNHHAMLATSKNVLFPGHNHLLTTGTDHPSLAGVRARIKVLGHQYRWLAGGYDLEIGHF